MFNFIPVHISQIKNGDTIKHDGKIRTVNQKDIKIDPFIGISIFGDSYNSGYKKVIFCEYQNPLKKGK